MCPTPRKRSTRQAAKPATNGAVKAEDSTATAPKASARATGSKRKVKDEDEGEDDYESEEAKPKKRKTTTGKGKKKDEDMVPLASRTAVTSLKKAMYIGAHVSSAGGTTLPLPTHHVSCAVPPCPIPRKPVNCDFLTLRSHRCPKRSPKCNPHRRQCLCSLPQVPAQVDQPASSPGRPRPVPLPRRHPRLRLGKARPPARQLPRQPRPGRRRQG